MTSATMVVPYASGSVEKINIWPNKGVECQNISATVIQIVQPETQAIVVLSPLFDEKDP